MGKAKQSIMRKENKQQDGLLPSCCTPNLTSYYFNFKPTGDQNIDEILSAVAAAAKAHHSTGGWDEPQTPRENHLIGETYIDTIQNAANRAANR